MYTFEFETLQNDEEDLDELELRLAALASAAKAIRKALEESTSGSSAKSSEQKATPKDGKRGSYSMLGKELPYPRGKLRDGIIPKPCNR